MRRSLPQSRLRCADPPGDFMLHAYAIYKTYSTSHVASAVPLYKPGTNGLLDGFNEGQMRSSKGVWFGESLSLPLYPLSQMGERS